MVESNETLDEVGESNYATEFRATGDTVIEPLKHKPSTQQKQEKH
jgi:hypothetical protein